MCPNHVSRASDSIIKTVSRSGVSPKRSILVTPSELNLDILTLYVILFIYIHASVEKFGLTDSVKKKISQDVLNIRDDLDSFSSLIECNFKQPTFTVCTPKRAHLEISQSLWRTQWKRFSINTKMTDLMHSTSSQSIQDDYFIKLVIMELKANMGRWAQTFERQCILYHTYLSQHAFRTFVFSTLLCTVCFQVLLDAVTMVYTGLLKTNESHCVLYSIKCLKRGENTHHLCSRSFNVSEWNGDHLIVSRRQSILSLQMLSPRTLVVKDCNRWNSLKLVQSHKDSPARALTGSNNPHSPQSAKAARHFFACKWHNTIILQAGKTGLRRETQYRLGTYTETNKQVWLVLHWGLKGKHPSGGERMVQYSWGFFFYTRLALQLLRREMFCSD